MRRHKLYFGPYRTPLFRIGQHVEDERRGLVRIVGVSDGKIPWPIGYAPGGNSLVLYKGLARAVRREAAAAVMHWWGVGQLAGNKWRRALGVPRWNDGDLRLKTANGKRNMRAIRAMLATVRDPAARAKSGAARRGKPRPPHVIEALRRANIGRKLTADHRRKIGDAHKRLRTRPPKAGQAVYHPRAAPDSHASASRSCRADGPHFGDRLQPTDSLGRD